MTYSFTRADCSKSAISRRIERSQGLAFAARWRAKQGRMQFVLPAGAKLPEPGRARPTAYTGPYPILHRRTCADLIAEGVL